MHPATAVRWARTWWGAGVILLSLIPVIAMASQIDVLVISVVNGAPDAVTLAPGTATTMLVDYVVTGPQGALASIDVYRRYTLRTGAGGVQEFVGDQPVTIPIPPQPNQAETHHPMPTTLLVDSGATSGAVSILTIAPFNVVTTNPQPAHIRNSDTVAVTVPVAELMMYQVPFPGRQTARSALPSPLKSPVRNIAGVPENSHL